MKITLLSDERIRLETTPGPLTIEAESATMQYSPFHMVASGIATCVMSVLHSWAAHADLDAEPLTVDVTWSFADQPHRVGRYEIELRWPGLPASRLQAAQRAASLCAVHNTLSHPPELETRVTT